MFRPCKPTVLAKWRLSVATLSTTSTSDNKGNNRGPRGSKLGQTSVFFQSGLKIRELPLVVKKVNDVLDISGMDRYPDDIAPNAKKNAIKVKNKDESEEEKEIIAGFDRCFTLNGIMRLLQMIPIEEVTPKVAVNVLKKIIQLDNNIGYSKNRYKDNVTGKII